MVAGSRQHTPSHDTRPRRSVPLTREQWDALKVIARMEQRSVQSQMSIMLGDAISRYRPTEAKKANASR